MVHSTAYYNIWCGILNSTKTYTVVTLNYIILLNYFWFSRLNYAFFIHPRVTVRELQLQFFRSRFFICLFTKLSTNWPEILWRFPHETPLPSRCCDASIMDPRWRPSLYRYTTAVFLALRRFFQSVTSLSASRKHTNETFDHPHFSTSSPNFSTSRRNCIISQNRGGKTTRCDGRRSYKLLRNKRKTNCFIRFADNVSSGSCDYQKQLALGICFRRMFVTMIS